MGLKVSHLRWLRRALASASMLVALLAVSLAHTAAARAYDDPVEPSVIVHLLAEATESDPDVGFLAKALPTLASEDFAPIGEVRYRNGLSQFSLGLEESAAKTTAFNITSLSERASPLYKNVQEVIRDCSRDALDKTAWDLWWSWANHDSSFQPEEAMTNAAEGCLDAYIKKVPLDAREEIVKAAVEYITAGAKIVSEQQNDSSNYADWLQILRSSIEP